MRILQITDIHIAGEHERPHNIDARGQFLAILEAINQLQPDQVVLSGDLCFRAPSERIYSWIAEQLNTLNVQTHLLAGNHDGQRIMNAAMDCVYHEDTDEIYFSEEWMGIPVLFLDTARGVISETQYAWIEESLQHVSEQLIFFMHHPPIYCGVPHMDENYAFREIPRIQELLTAHDASFHIFCGHYHVERDIQVANQNIHITPSTYFQIDGNQREFGIDHHRPGYRIIEIDGDGLVNTRCEYLSM